MPTPDKNERRRVPRLGIPVYVQAFSEIFPLGFLINISPEGMFVQSTEPKEVGTRIDLSFQPDPAAASIKMTTEVMWVNYPPSFSEYEDYSQGIRSPVADNPGMGLRIIDITPQDKARLDDFIKQTEATAFA